MKPWRNSKQGGLMSFVRAANICTMRAATQNDITFWSVFQFLRTFRTYVPFTIISNRYIKLIFNMLGSREAGVFKFLQSEERS